MLATYHNHSTYSDGKATVSGMIDAAAALGVGEVGLSDHLTPHPAGLVVPWSMKPEDLDPYVREVREQAARREVVVRLGLELDWFDGHAAMLAEIIDSHPFDYVIGSVHFIGEFPVDGNPHRWKALSQDEVDAIHREYWARIARMASSGLFTIAAHLDLPKKFGFVPRVQPEGEIERALDAIASAGMVVELNTAGWHKPCADAYPSLDLLRRCRQRGIETTLSADAHHPQDLVRDFDRGAQRLREAGYARLARFAERTARLEPIDASVAAGPGDPRAKAR